MSRGSGPKTIADVLSDPRVKKIMARIEAEKKLETTVNEPKVTSSVSNDKYIETSNTEYHSNLPGSINTSYHQNFQINEPKVIQTELELEIKEPTTYTNLSLLNQLPIQKIEKKKFASRTFISLKDKKDVYDADNKLFLKYLGYSCKIVNPKERVPKVIVENIYLSHTECNGNPITKKIRIGKVHDSTTLDEFKHYMKNNKSFHYKLNNSNRISIGNECLGINGAENVYYLLEDIVMPNKRNMPIANSYSKAPKKQ